MLQFWSFMCKYRQRDEVCTKLKSELQQHKTEMERIRTNEKKNESIYKCLKSKGEKQ